MAATLKQIGELIAERAGRQLDIPFQREMQDLVILKRARFLTNSLEKKPQLAKYYLQAFEVEIREINKTNAKDECEQEEEMLPDGCDIAYKTIKEIPDSLKFGVHPFSYVGAPGGHKGYGWTTFGTESTLRALPIVGKRPRYTFINNYIYIFNEANVKKIRIEGIFGDPRDLAPFFKCGTKLPCFSETEKFPVDQATLEVIIKDICSVELRLQPKQEDIELKVDKKV